MIWVEWRSSLIVVFSHFWILAWTQPYQASGNWIIHDFAKVFVKKKRKEEKKKREIKEKEQTPSSCPYVPCLYFPALWRASWLLWGRGSGGCVQNLRPDSLFPIWDGTEYESKKGWPSSFPWHVGSFDNGYSPVPEYFIATLYMVLHCRCFWLYLFFIIKMYKTYILK